jgi:hypothetical protein
MNDLWEFLLYNKQGFVLKPLEEVHVELVIRKTPAPDSGS